MLLYLIIIINIIAKDASWASESCRLNWRLWREQPPVAHLCFEVLQPASLLA